MNGLTSTEAISRLKKFGFNELKKKTEYSYLKVFFSQFKSPLIYILVFAGLVSGLLKEFTDAVVISVAVLVNAGLGFFQEVKAQKTLQALKSLLTVKAKVIRDNEQQIIDAREVVSGDLVALTIGDRIPADGKLAEATDLTVNESLLTGESLPIRKREGNSIFMGTTVVAGIAKMVVTKIGMETEMGKIGKTVVEVEEEKTPLQVQLSKLARILTVIVGVISAATFALGGIFGYAPLEMFTTSVAIAVAAIPEGLVVTLTIILALGMQRILKRKAVVRRLIAAETLGSVSTICTDKTGTLTEGKMAVAKADFVDLGLGLKASVLCNDLRGPLEVGMLNWARQQLGQPAVEKLKKENPRLDEMPFSPKTKMVATLHSRSGQSSLLFVSGAPEVVLEKSTADKVKWLKKFEEYGGKGYRLVGFAYKKFPTSVATGNLRGARKIENSDLKGLVWLGILIYEDPVREGVKLALEECQQAGIKLKVITGDYLPTALAVLQKLGLDGEGHSLTGDQLEKMSKEELNQVIDQIVLFARTNPEQKLKIIQTLKDKGEVVAMMGDGVNDAPALKRADIGIVVGSASDVAKETADMVLLDSKFATIIHAVEEGRTIFENIKKVALYLLSDSFCEVVLVCGSIILGLPLPVTAAQILWINLAEDVFPAIALAFEPAEKGLMAEPPRSEQSPILDQKMKMLIFVIGLAVEFFLLALFYWLNRGFLDLHYINTVMFVALGIDSLFIAFACRSLRKTVFTDHPFANKHLNLSVALGLILLIGAVYFLPLQKLLKTQPLGLTEWLFLFAFGAVSLLAIEGGKLVLNGTRR